jgi:hypothetical protein
MRKSTLIILSTLLLLSCSSIATAFADEAVGDTEPAEEVQKQILPTSPLYLFVKVKESVQQFLTFSPDAKTQLLENFTAQRIREMEYADFAGDDQALEASLSRYQAQKKQSLGYVKGASDAKVVEDVKERTVEQQQKMTQVQVKTEVSDDVRHHIVKVQKEVAMEIGKTIKTVQGDTAAAEVDNEIRYVWLDPNADAEGKLPPLPDEIKEWEYAPGTDGRDETGKMIEITYAPGTTAGGESGNKIEIVWEPGTEESGEDTVDESGPQVVVEKDTGTGTGGEGKKVVIQQAPPMGGGEGKQLKIEQAPGGRGK